MASLFQLPSSVQMPEQADPSTLFDPVHDPRAAAALTNYYGGKDAMQRYVDTMNEQASPREQWTLLNGIPAQYNESRDAYIVPDPTNGPGFFAYRKGENGDYTESYDKPYGGGWLDHVTNALGDVMPAVTTALIAFMSGGAASGAMGGAGAAAGGAEGGMAGAGTTGGGFGAEAGAGAGGFGAADAGATGFGGFGGLGVGAGGDYGALGSGMYGTGDTAMSGLMGTAGDGTFQLGSGLSGISAADLSSAGSGFDWVSQAQKIAKSLLNGQQSGGAAGSGQVGGGGAGGSGLPAGGQSPMLQSNYQSPNLMPTFSTAPAPVSNDELQNSANIRLLAQGLRGNNGY